MRECPLWNEGDGDVCVRKSFGWKEVYYGLCPARKLDGELDGFTDSEASVFVKSSIIFEFDTFPFQVLLADSAVFKSVDRSFEVNDQVGGRDVDLECL